MAKGGDDYRHGISVKRLAGLSHNSRTSVEPSSKTDGIRNALSTLHIIKANRPVQSIPIEFRCEEHIATNHLSIACANISILNTEGKWDKLSTIGLDSFKRKFAPGGEVEQP